MSSRGRSARASCEPQQQLEILPEDLFLLVRAQALEPLHPGDRRGMPRHEGPVAAQYHPIAADLVQEEPQRLLAADHRVVVEPALIAAWRLRDRAVRLGRAMPVP